ncbi:MAG: hypothetical protein KAQ99_01780 [Candidatus Aureabacteria bacterium]|nr:hypothetical protein [Candidatus Auribacterota bacterium]
MTDIINIGTGGYHGFAVKSDGTLWAWGSNSLNALGDGTDADQWSPVPVLVLTDVINAVGAWGLSLALKSDGTVWGWGGCFGGLAGEYNDYIDEVPFQIPGLDNIIDIAVGNDFFLALKSDGTVWSWGENGAGRLGVGTDVDNYYGRPAQVLVLTDVTEIACGSYHGLARKSDNSIWAWGYNGYGQLGIGDESITSKRTPVKVLPIESNTSPVISSLIPDITTPENTPVGLDLTSYESDTEDGPAGEGNNLIWFIAGVNEALFTASIDTITDELTITPVVDAAGSDVITLILTDSGGLTDTQDVEVTIGADNNPPVIDSPVVNIETPENTSVTIDLSDNETDVEDGSGDNNGLEWSISDVDTALFSATINLATDELTIDPVENASGVDDTVTLTLTDSGGLTAVQNITVTITAADVGISSIAGGGAHSYVIYEETIWSWGWNSWGQLGDGTTENNWSPASIGFGGIDSLAGAGYKHSLVLKSDKTVWGWGGNSSCQLGIGDAVEDSVLPVQTDVLEDIITVNTGHHHGLALKSDGTVWAWGLNDCGQIGIGPDTPEEMLTPVQVPGLSEIIDIAGGGYHSLAVKSDGTVWAWGWNSWDQLGDGTGVDQWSPIQVLGLTDAVGACAGYENSMVLKSDGTVWGWGNAFWSITEDETVPSQIPGFDNVMDIASGDSHMLALKSDGTIWALGDNYYGQLGIGTRMIDQYGLPAQVMVLTDVIEIACGHYHSLARKSDGSIWAWGSNLTGEVGIGDESVQYQLTPVKVLPIEANTSPVILPGISDITTSENTPVGLDLTSYESDTEDGPAGEGNGLIWFIAGVNEDLFTASIDPITDELTITPVVDTAGSDVITLILADSGGLTDTQDVTVTITAVNNPPEIDPVVSVITTDEDTDKVVDLSDNEKDVEDGSGDDNGLEWSITGVDTSLFSATINVATDELTIDPVENASGNDAVTLTLTDSGELTVSQNVSITITAVNDPPEITPVVTPIETPENTSVTIDLSDNETDVEDGSGDDNGLEWSISDVDTALFSATINLATDEITIDPVENASGVDDTVTLTLTDSGGLTAVQNITVTITAAINNPPVIASVIPNITTSENTSAILDLTEYESDTEDGPAADGNSLTWSISGVDETLFTASIDSADVLTIIPEFDASGTDVVTLALTDSGGLTDSQDIIIGVIGGLDISGIAGGGSHSYVVYEEVVWAWGYNANGQIGNDTTEQKWIPVSIGFTDVVSLASGGYAHSCTLQSDGTIWGWGKNSSGEIGIGTDTNSEPVPVQTLVLEDIMVVEIGAHHGLALKSDRTVLAWGYNGSGQIGIGPDTPDEVLTPVQVPGLTDIISIAGGAYCSFAVKLDGTVWGWGDNSYALLADDSYEDQWSPVPIPGLFDVIKVQAGYQESVALKSDGTVWGWGDGFYATLDNYTVPSRIPGFDSIIDIAVGDAHILALKSDGTVLAWGYNFQGQLGIYTQSDELGLPVQVLFLDDVTEIACGHYHSLARKSDGSIWAWGSNAYGEVGIGDSILYQRTPVKVLPIEANAPPVILPGISDITIVGDDTSVTLDLTDYESDVEDGPAADNNDLRWFIAGVDESVFSASIDPVTEILTVTPVPYASGVCSVTLILADSGGLTDTHEMIISVWGKSPTAVGGGHNLFLQPDGTVLAWGSGNKGQLGNGVSGTGYSEETPVSVLNITNIAAVSAGYDHSLALASDGTVWAWGLGGALGDGILADSSIPVNPLGLSGIVAISAGYYHNLALDSDGNVWSWGANESGQLGNDTLSYLDPPSQIAGLTNIIAIATGGYHSLALDSDGNVWAWGSNSEGQLGDETTDSRHTPEKVIASGVSSITAITAGEATSYALRSNTTVWNERVYGWGDGGWGALAQGGDDWADKLSPVIVVPDGVKTIAAGGGHIFFIKTDGTLEACGQNSYGQLGDETTEPRNYLVPVVGLTTGAVAVAAGPYESLGLKSDGTLWDWGISSNVPVEVVLP